MLTKENIEILKKKLTESQKDLEAQIKDVEKTPEFGSDVDHFEEETDEAEEFSKNLGEAKAFRERLENVLRALTKMETGTYGVCEQCGKDIAWPLLEVDPESQLCKTCKEKTRRL
jgi:DnaK suppressor protein